MRQATSAPALMSQHVSAAMDTKTAAIYLGVSESYLNKLRVQGGSPRYLKIGRRVVYRRQELDSWAEQKSRTSTSDERAA